MASIEIDSNTVIKLLARRGSDQERKNIILAEGEFGYVVDLKRLYIGDGVTPGGIPTSVKFHNTTTNITNISETIKINDLVYKSDTNEIYKLVSGDGSSLSDWELISSPKYVVVDNATIGLSASNGELFVKEISGKHISTEALGSGLSKVANKITVSGDINVNTVTSLSSYALTAVIDKIEPYTQSSLTIPNALTFTDNISSVLYTFPLSGGSDKYHLVTDGSGNLSWEPAEVVVTNMSYISDATVSTPVGTILFYAASSFTDPDGWFICNGRSLVGTQYRALSAAIGTTYGGNATNFNIPNLTGGSMLFGAGRFANTVGTIVPLRGATSIVQLTGTAMSGLSASLSAIQINTASVDLSAQAGVWIIKHRQDIPVTTIFNINTAFGLSAFNVTENRSVTAIGLTGTYNLHINEGGVGTGNQNVVKGYNKARSRQMFTFTNVGSSAYTVSNNIYEIKVTVTGPGGVGYTRYDLGGGNYSWRANGTQGGAGGTVVGYINVTPGERFIAYVGQGGRAIRTTDPVPEDIGITAGWGFDSGFVLSAGDVFTTILSAKGAYDPVSTGEAAPYYSDWTANGEARGGIRGGIPIVPGDPRVASYLLLTGGDGGQFMTNGPSGPGAAGIYGSGPAPGGGGSGYARSDSAGREIAPAGNGLVIVEEL